MRKPTVTGLIRTEYHAGGVQIQRGWCRVSDGTIAAADVLVPQIDPPPPGRVRMVCVVTSAEGGRYAECVTEDRPAK